VLMPAPVGVTPVGAAPVGVTPVGAAPVGAAAVGAARTPEPVPARPPGRAGPGWDGPGPGRPDAGRIEPREFALRLRRGASSVWVEVFDPDLRLPRIRTAADTDEGGRGLYLVEQLATRWGSRPTTDGKAVWFEMPRTGHRPL
jgi:hypothetical protein